MHINPNQTLSQGLALLTYNRDKIVMPKNNQLNVTMGIGLWSVKDGLSEGLPVDVMQMLLSAAMMRSQIIEANQGKSSKIIILLADSMAVREGANKEKVSELVQIYKKSLEPLLDLLNIKDSSEIILSSELESCMQYQEVLEFVENSRSIKQLKVEDQTHYAYVRTQTAITRYMHTKKGAGIKVGWICAESSKQLNDPAPAQSLKQWDELKFDRWCQAICEDTTMQYLYAKAGLKQAGQGKNVNIREGCPYTAFAKDRRYTVQTQQQKDIKTICPMPKRVAAHWKGIAEICSSLVEHHLVHTRLLPEGCIKKSNDIATVYNMLNHWANPPLVSRKLSLPPLDGIYQPTVKNVVVLNQPKPRQRCILL